MPGSHVPPITYDSVPRDGRNVFRDGFGALSDDEWCAVLGRSIAEPVIDGVRFPAFPNDDLQRHVHGSFGANAMAEAVAFYSFVKANTYSTVPAPPRMRLLDFGAGWGRTIRPFLRDVEFAGLFGFEPDFLFCTLARALNPYAAFLTGGTTPAGELPGGFFDVVFSWSVFSHLSPASAALWLQELARALVPGGTLVFTTWGARFLHRLRNEAAARAAGAAIDWYSGVCLDAAGSIEDRIGGYASGEFIWFTSGQSKVYGEAFISEAALARLLDEHRIPLVLVRSDTSTLGQDAFVLRRV